MMNALALACSSAACSAPVFSFGSHSRCFPDASRTLYISQHTLACNLVVRSVATDTTSILADSNNACGFTTR